MKTKRKGNMMEKIHGLPGFLLLSVALLGSALADAQGQTITGTVVDAEEGTPLPGVNIVVKGTAAGTSTDAGGEYQLTVESLQDTLVFSFIGYQTATVPVDGRTVINVSLQPRALVGEELVVIGYGQIQKRDLTGSVSSLNSEEFDRGVQVNVDQMIQGKVPGVRVIQNSARPGGGYTIRIRGTTSITAGNQPLYVIDGLPGAPVNALNPGDIESIEILKDASAAAIYGARGANGVILITTRKGAEGEIQVDYNASWGMQEISNKLDLLSAQEYMSFLNDLREDQGGTPVFTQEEMNTIGAGTDWQDAVLRIAPVQDHQLSFSGGSDDTRYYISLNYLNQDGIVINTDFKRYSARVNVNHSVDNFNFGINLNTSLVEDSFVPRGIGINNFAGVIGSSVQMDPTLPVRNEDGSYARSQVLDLNNPVAQANTIFNDLNTNRTFGNIYAGYMITDNLEARINFGSNRSISRSDNYVTDVTRRGQQTNGSANINANEALSYLAELTLNYEGVFNEVHQIDAVAGYTYQEFINRGFSARAQNFPTDAFRTNNLGAGDPEQYNVGSGRSKHQLLSYLGRINYSLLDKYLVTASFRIDGSSRFGEDQKYGYFPSLAVGWRLSEEPFMANLDVLSNLKLRASYGITGNQAIGNYNSLVLLGTSGDAIFDGTRFVSIAPVQLANPDLKWETTEQFNIGLDYGFLRDRITGSINYFVKKTSDLLLRLPIPRTTGFGRSLQNVGSTRNSGFEFMVNSRNLAGDFAWSTTLNFSTLHNEVTGLGELPLILQGGIRFLGNFTLLREEDPINAYFGYETEGIFQSQQEIDESAQPFASPGDIKFKDVNQDGQINPDDRTILGSPFPNVIFGLTNNFSYKGFGLDLFIEGSYGHEMLNFTRIDTENPFSFRRNRQAYVLDRWTPENPSTENPSFLNTNVSRAVNSRVVEDASYIRLKNLRLSYDFANLSLGGIRSLSVYANAQNLFTITNYRGYNPDVSVLGGSNIRVDYNAYPLAKTYTVGINIGI